MLTWRSVLAWWAVTDRLELFGAFEFFRIDQLITPISVNAIGIGHTRLGASFRFVESDRVGLAVHSKVVLPTAVPLYQNTRPLAVDLGVAGQFAVHDRVQLHADLGMIHSVGLGKGPGQPRIGATVNFGAEFRPAWRFSVVTDLHASFGYTEPLDVFAGALGLRFSDGKRFGVDAHRYHWHHADITRTVYKGTAPDEIHRLYEAVAAIFIAQAIGHPLGVGDQALIFVTATLAAIPE